MGSERPQARDLNYCHYTNLYHRNQQRCMAVLCLKYPLQNMMRIVMFWLLSWSQIERTLKLPSELQV